MLQKLIIPVLAALAVAASSVGARAATDGEVTTLVLARLYAPGAAHSHDPRLRQLYADEGYVPIWWHDGTWRPEAYGLVAALDDAASQGLDPVRYGTVMLDDVVNPHAAATLSDSKAAAAELALSEAVLTYIDDRVTGHIAPASLGWLATVTPRADAVAMLEQGLASGQVVAWLDGLAPARADYAALVPELAHYRAMAGLPWPAIPGGAMIKPDMTDPRVPALRERLALLGDLDDAALAPGADPQLFDSALVAATRRFQARHGLDADGIVGPITLAALNVTPAARVRTIEANMERMRWMPPRAQHKGRHIEINLAAFELTAYIGDKPVLVMPVIVGQRGWPTPIFSDRIVSVTFEPSWTVPASIARQELLPKLKQDPAYLAENHFRVFADWGRGGEVNPASVDWKKVAPSAFNYMLRQQPGPTNALGLIRFETTNSYDIFLHDTGSPKLFAEAVRSLSHGCIRVSEPVGLAQYVLGREREPWSYKQIVAAMHGGKTRTQPLKYAVPVDLAYVTAWVDGAGRMQFRDDIYGRDRRLLAALAASDARAVIDLPRVIGTTNRPESPLSVSGTAAKAGKTSL